MLQGFVMGTTDKKEELQDMIRKIETANGFRLIFLCVGVLLLLFLYFGDKFFGGAAWFATASGVAFRIAEWDIILMVIATFVKLFFTTKYNQLVKRG